MCIFFKFREISNLKAVSMCIFFKFRVNQKLILDPISVVNCFIFALMIPFENNLLSEIDPDVNYFDDLVNNSGSETKYISNNDFGNLIKNTDLLSILSYNIRSFHANSDYFTASFLNSQKVPSIIVLTETWFSLDSVINLPGYNSYHTVRDGRGGGVSVFIDKKFTSKKIPSFSYSSCSIEVCTVSIFCKKEEMYIIGIYRPHSDSIENFTISLNNILDELGNKYSVIAGDFNKDILQSNTKIASFSNNMQSYHFLPIISKPTRFHPNDLVLPSLLDHIWINRVKSYDSYIITADFTDHLPVFVLVQNFLSSSADNSVGKKITFRQINDVNKQKFENLIMNFRWDSMKNSDLNLCVEIFLTKLNFFYCSAFPLKTKTISTNRSLNPWITPYITKLIKAKSTYFKLMTLGIITKAENNYFKNQVTSKIKKCKTLYYHEIFKQNSSCIKKTWSLIRSLLSNGNSSHSIKNILFNNLEICNSLDISKIFNEFFYQSCD